MFKSLKNSSWVLTLRLRWQRSSTSWRLKRLASRLTKEQQRETLLLMSLDSCQLRVKELGEQTQQLSRRQAEMVESRQYRETGQLPLLPPSPTELDKLLGLMPPH